MLGCFSICVHYTRYSGHRADIGSMCAVPRRKQLSSFRVPKYVLISPDIEASFITVPALWVL